MPQGGLMAMGFAGEVSAVQGRDALAQSVGYAAGPQQQLPSIAGTALPLRAARYRPGAATLCFLHACRS